MKKYISTLIIVLIAIVAVQAQTYKVIVNNSNTTTTLSKSEVSKYFLKKRKEWNIGIGVAPVDLGSRSTIRKDFSKEVHHKTIAQIRAFWQQSVFSGKATPPLEMKSDAEVVAFVKENKGAIGYVSSDANIEGVKVLTIN